MQEMAAPFGSQPVSTVAMAASQHFKRFGTTRETLGWIAINARNNASINPTAVFRDPITMDDYLVGSHDLDAVRPVRLRPVLRRVAGRRRVGGRDRR